jgi:hypothetical protein
MTDVLDDEEFNKLVEWLKERPVDPNLLVEYVLRESYMATTEDLRLYAEKVKLLHRPEAGRTCAGVSRVSPNARQGLHELVRDGGA